LSPFFAHLHAFAWSRRNLQIASIYRGFSDYGLLHRIAPNRTKFRYKPAPKPAPELCPFFAIAPVGPPLQWRRFETGTDTRTQRILALQPKQNRHQDFVKPSSNQSETDMQPAPTLLRDFYPTYGAVKRPSAVLENGIVRPVWVVQFTVRFWAPISTRRIGSRSSRLQRSSRRSCGFRTRAALETSWAP
jgi:hypothetical protein